VVGTHTAATCRDSVERTNAFPLAQVWTVPVPSVFLHGHAFMVKGEFIVDPAGQVPSE
jgi:hypothetical protein